MRCLQCRKNVPNPERKHDCVPLRARPPVVGQHDIDAEAAMLWLLNGEDDPVVQRYIRDETRRSERQLAS